MTRNRRYGMKRTFSHILTQSEVERDEIKRAADAAAEVKAKEPLPVKIRGINGDDLAFVYDSWCASYSKSPVVGPVQPDLFKIEQRACVTRLLPKSKQIVLCDPTEPKLIRGWICYTPPPAPGKLPTIHYMLVKPEFQGRGLARTMTDLVRTACALDATSPMFYSHYTGVMRQVERRLNLIYNPYLLQHGAI